MKDISLLLQEIILALHKLGTIEVSVIASRDGVLISSDMADDKRAQNLAAMSATMLGAAETISMELGRGLPGRVIVESGDAKLICMGAGPKALMVIIAQPEAGLGLLIVELEKAVSKIKEIM